MRILRIILSVLLAGFLLLLPCLLIIDYAMPMFGYSFHVIITGSMEPTIRLDDLVIARHCKPEDVQVGDIIMFNTKPHYFSPLTIVPRRVVQMNTELYGEQGLWLLARDDRSDPQEPEIITAQNLIGKVVGRLPRLGLVVMFMRFSYLGALAILLFCWSAAVVIMLPVFRMRRSRRDVRKN